MYYCAALSGRRMFLEVTRILGEGTRIGENPGINTPSPETLDLAGMN
jgi:hypothetical protein